MKKLYKVVKIIFIVLGVLVAVGFAALYVFNNELAKSIVDRVKDFVNRPLPIVGCSLVIVGTFALNIFKNSVYGKNFLTRAQKEYTDYREELDEHEKLFRYNVAKVIDDYNEREMLIINAFKEVCDSIPNVKVKQTSERLISVYGAKKEETQKLVEELFKDEERINCETKENEM